LCGDRDVWTTDMMRAKGSECVGSTERAWSRTKSWCWKWQRTWMLRDSLGSMAMTWWVSWSEGRLHPCLNLRSTEPFVVWRNPATSRVSGSPWRSQPPTAGMGAQDAITGLRRSAATLCVRSVAGLVSCPDRSSNAKRLPIGQPWLLFPIEELHACSLGDETDGNAGNESWGVCRCWPWYLPPYWEVDRGGWPPRLNRACPTAGIVAWMTASTCTGS